MHAWSIRWIEDDFKFATAADLKQMPHTDQGSDSSLHGGTNCIPSYTSTMGLGGTKKPRVGYIDLKMCHLSFYLFGNELETGEEG